MADSKTAGADTMSLVLIRHGESEWNKLNLFTGWTDVDLTDTGTPAAARPQTAGAPSPSRASTSTYATPRCSSAPSTPSTSSSTR